MSNHPLILIVDDDVKLATRISKGLEQASFQVEHITTPDATFEWLQIHRPNIIILDIDLRSYMNGYDICQRIRQGGQVFSQGTDGQSYFLNASDFESIPILMLTGRDSNDDQIRGYGVGTNLYLPKRNLNLKLLIAQLNALLINSIGGAKPKRNALRIQDVSIYPDPNLVRVGVTEVNLTALEFEVIYWLASNCGIPQSKQVLLENCWENASTTKPRTVDVCIRRLREKLELVNSTDIIKSKYGQGYYVDC